jgi:hypothetical protein
MNAPTSFETFESNTLRYDLAQHCTTRCSAQQIGVSSSRRNPFSNAQIRRSVLYRTSNVRAKLSDNKVTQTCTKVVSLPLERLYVDTNPGFPVF